MVRRLLRCVPACLAVAILWAVTMNTSAQVLIVLSDGHTGYEEAAQEMRASLRSVREGRLRIDAVQVQGLASVGDAEFNAYKLVVTIGLSAAQATVEREDALRVAPLTLCLLIGRYAFEEELLPPKTGTPDRRRSAVFIDQPVSRQLELIRIALPERNHVGVIVSRYTPRLRREILEGAQERGLTVHLSEVRPLQPGGNNIYGALQSVIPESNVLLVVPIPFVLDSRAIHDYLLTSYRAKMPVVGFSEAQVTGGALLSLYSTPRQQGRQAAAIAARILADGGGLPAPQYPIYFTVRVNASVARSMGLRMQDESDLADALAKRDEISGNGPGTLSDGRSAAPQRGP
jgi:hypothetical protein